MYNDNSIDKQVKQHYTVHNLGNVILSALEASGKDISKLKTEDLAPVDEFHIRGREATLELATQLNLDDKKHVLDVGSGVGGASRLIALEFGCRVTGIDLTEENCRAAQMLTDKIGLGSRVTFHQCNALDMPFGDESFDVVWTQHVSSNIPDKLKLYSEIHRVLRPGGLLALYNIMEGPGGKVIFPVPWAREPSSSFLVPPPALHSLLKDTGFKILNWKDTTEEGCHWFHKMAKDMQTQSQKTLLGFNILMGPDFPIMFQNQILNVCEKRIVLIEAVAKR
jgi:ubiquinone/menaquinone biosynthesis C-methylase UbiE